VRRVATAVALVVLALGTCVGGAACSGGNGRTQPKPIKTPEDVPVPNDPASTAALLTRVERELRSPTTNPADINRLGWQQQDAYRALSAHPHWVDDVLAHLPNDLQPIVTANERAGRDLERLGEGSKPHHLPEWHIAPPLPAEVLRSYYAEAEAATGIPWAYLASIHLVETRLGRIQGTSSAGAQGPMQFLPATWERYGQGNIDDNHDSILAAARLLQANGGPGDMNGALFRYNHSNSYVIAVESYAQLMLAEERAFLGYHGWQVFYATTEGTFLLPEGYPGKAAEHVPTSDGGS
jgi:Transglycosylase SLT domain